MMATVMATMAMQWGQDMDNSHTQRQLRAFIRSARWTLTLVWLLSILFVACTGSTQITPEVTTSPPVPVPSTSTPTLVPTSTPSPSTPTLSAPTPTLQSTLPANFPATSLLLANNSGQLILLELPSGEQYELTAPNVFQIGLSQPFWTPPRESPTGKHWILPQPDGQGTWVVSIEEKNAYRIHEQSLATTWSPTGDRVAYSLGNELYVRDIRDGQSPELLGHWGEMILAASWSPVDDLLAIVVKPDESATPSDAVLEVLTVDVRSGEATTLGSFAALETASTAMDLAWSPDGQ